MKLGNVPLATALVGFVYLLLLIGAVGFLWWPARDAVQLEREKAHDAAMAMTKMADSHIGRDFAIKLKGAGTRLASKQAEFEADLAARTTELRRWFPDARMNASLGLPYANEFRRAYAFAQDQLRREVLNARERSALQVTTDIPLSTPTFMAEKRDPSGREEMLAAQVAFNLESGILRKALAHQAFPVQATRIRSLAEPVETDFESIELRLVLAMPSAQVPALLRSVRTAAGKEPVFGIEGLSLEPGPIPADLGEGKLPPVILRLRVVAKILEVSPEAS